MGLFFKRTKPDEELLRDGLRGHATVLHVSLPRTSMSTSMSRKKGEEMMKGDITPIRRKVRLRVEVPGRAQYELETKISIPVLQSGHFVAGSGLAVLVDPEDPKNLAVDWQAGIQRGSVATMLQDMPMANAMFQGMGIDPQQLAQRIDQAQQQAAAWQQNPGPPPAGWPAGMAWPPPQGWPQPQAWPQQLPGVQPTWPVQPPVAQPQAWPPSEPLPSTDPQSEPPAAPPA
ncbi:MAG: hypothetical protein ACJ77A_14995 [Actinomycetota bacterium]